MVLFIIVVQSLSSSQVRLNTGNHSPFQTTSFAGSTTQIPKTVAALVNFSWCPLTQSRRVGIDLIGAATLAATPS
jgi:hypothetical protein